MNKILTLIIDCTLEQTFYKDEVLNEIENNKNDIKAVFVINTITIKTFLEESLKNYTFNYEILEVKKLTYKNYNIIFNYINNHQNEIDYFHIINFNILVNYTNLLKKIKEKKFDVIQLLNFSINNYDYKRNDFYIEDYHQTNLKYFINQLVIHIDSLFNFRHIFNINTTAREINYLEYLYGVKLSIEECSNKFIEETNCYIKINESWNTTYDLIILLFSVVNTWNLLGTDIHDIINKALTQDETELNIIWQKIIQVTTDLITTKYTINDYIVSINNNWILINKILDSNLLNYLSTQYNLFIR